MVGRVPTGRWFALVAGAVLVLGGCSKRGGTPTSGGSPSPSPAPSESTTPLQSGERANFHGIKDVSGMANMEFELDDYYFGPTILTGKPGQTLKLEIHNEGRNQHNLTLASEGINQTFDPDKTGEVTVTFPQSGSAPFHCVFHGASNNMRGELRTSG
jgi:plastocyanin